MKVSAGRPARFASKSKAMTSTGHFGKQGQLFGRRAEQGRLFQGLEEVAGMRLEGDDDRVEAGDAAFVEQGLENAVVAQVHAVEIPQGDHAGFGARDLVPGPGNHGAAPGAAAGSRRANTLRGLRRPSTVRAAMASSRPAESCARASMPAV